MFVEFVCNDCGTVVACAREEHIEAAIHALELNCPVATAGCPHCDFTNVVVGPLNTACLYLPELRRERGGGESSGQVRIKPIRALLTNSSQRRFRNWPRDSPGFCPNC